MKNLDYKDHKTFKVSNFKITTEKRRKSIKNILTFCFSCNYLVEKYTKKKSIKIIYYEFSAFIKTKRRDKKRYY